MPSKLLRLSRRFIFVDEISDGYIYAEELDAHDPLIKGRLILTREALDAAGYNDIVPLELVLTVEDR